MHLNPNTTVIIGPPGTGKTRELIRRVTTAIGDGTNPEYIGYVSFTKQAIREARDRVILATGNLVTVDRLSGFRTLHAMAYWLLGLQRHSVIDPSKLYEISGMASKTIVSHSAATETSRLYSHMYNYHRVTKLSLGDVWRRLKVDRIGDEEEFLLWVQKYLAFKKATNQIDFNDMVDRFICHNVSFPFEYLFVDEAQDFTPNQWAMVKLLADSADHVIIAGDPNQNIFTWAGADSGIFGAIEADVQVLRQSYRVPNLPYQLAQRVIGKNKQVYYPTHEAGSVNWIFHHNVHNLPFNNGETWFLLCRNQCHLTRIKKDLFDRQVFFQELSISPNAGNDKILKRIRWYKEAVDGKELTPYRKEKLEELVPDLQGAIRCKIKWDGAFQNLPASKLAYYRNTEAQWTSPKVFVGTFHSSKGMEADNVVLFSECTTAVADAYDKQDPNEYKVLYVAVTRTKKNLYIVQSNELPEVPWNHFIKLPQDLTSSLL